MFWFKTLFRQFFIIGIDDGEGAGADSGSKTVPYERFKAVNDEKINLKSQLKDLESQLVEAKSSISSYEEKMKNLAEEYEAKLKESSEKIESLQSEKESTEKQMNDDLLETKFQYKLLEAGANDKDYLEYLVTKKINQFEGDEDAFEKIDDIIGQVKEENPELWKQKRDRTPGGAPAGDQSEEETLTERHLREAREKGYKIG